jgi:cytochrome c556
VRRGQIATVLLIAGALAACGEGPLPELPEPPPPRDLSMLALMMRIDPAYRGMLPHLRDEARLDDLAAAADQIVAACEDPVFVGWTARDDFRRDPAIWDESYADLLGGARDAAAAARAGDLETLHAAYGVMSRSCTACHKRYSPHQ